MLGNFLVCNSFKENMDKSHPLEIANSTVSTKKTSIEKMPVMIAENLNHYDSTSKLIALKKNEKRKVAHIFAWCTQYTTDNIVDKKTPVRESTRKVNSDFQKNNNVKVKSILKSPRPLKNNISKLLKHTSPLKTPGKDKCNQEVLDKNPEQIQIDLVKQDEKLLNVKDDDVILLKKVNFETPAQQDNKLSSTDDEVIFLEEIHGTTHHHKDTKGLKEENYGNKSRDMSGKSKMPHTVAFKNNRHPLLNKLIKKTQENRTCTNKYKERLRTCSKSDPQYALTKPPKSCENNEVRTKSMKVNNNNNNTNLNQLRIANNIIDPKSKISSSSVIKSECIKGTKPQYIESLETISDDLKTKTYHKMSPSDKTLCSDKSDGSSHTGMYREEELISSLKMQDTNSTIATCEDLYGRNKLNLRSCYVLSEKLDLPKQNSELNCQNLIVTSNGALNSNTKSVCKKSASENQQEVSFSKSKQTEENKCSVPTNHVLGIAIKKANNLSSSHLKNISPLDNKLQINKTMKRHKTIKTPNIFQQWIDFYKSNEKKSNSEIMTTLKVHKKVSADGRNVEEGNCESYENKSHNIKIVMFKSDSSEGDIRKAIKRGIQTSKHNVSTNDNNSTNMCEHQVSQHIPTIKRPRRQLRKSSHKIKYAQQNESQLINPLKTKYELRSNHSPTVNCKNNSIQSRYDESIRNAHTDISHNSLTNNLTQYDLNQVIPRENTLTTEMKTVKYMKTINSANAVTKCNVKVSLKRNQDSNESNKEEVIRKQARKINICSNGSSLDVIKLGKKPILDMNSLQENVTNNLSKANITSKNNADIKLKTPEEGNSEFRGFENVPYIGVIKEIFILNSMSLQDSKNTKDRLPIKKPLNKKNSLNCTPNKQLNRSSTFLHGEKKKPVNNMPCKVIEQGFTQDIKLGEASGISKTLKDNMSESKQISIMKDKDNMPPGSCEFLKEDTDYDVTKQLTVTDCADVSRADNMKISYTEPLNRTCDYDCKNCNNLQLENSDSSAEGKNSSDLEAMEERLLDILHRMLQCAKSKNQLSPQKWERKCSINKDNRLVCSTPVSIDPKEFEQIECVQDKEHKSAKEPKIFSEYSRLPFLQEIETPDKDEHLKLRLNDLKRRRLKKTMSWPDISRSCQNKIMTSLEHCVNSTFQTNPDESSAENKSVSNEENESFTAEENRSRLTTEKTEVFYNKLNCSETECVPETNQPCDSVEGKYTRLLNKCSVS